MKRRGALALMALGILLAGGASVLVLGIARQANEASRAVIPQVYVVMAAREIPDQTQITPDELVIRPFPADFAPAGAIATPDQAVGKFAVSTIYKDQMLLQGHVSVAKRQASLSDRVPVGKVVVWLPMPSLIGGQIGFKPGDRLDILLSLPLTQVQSTAQTDDSSSTTQSNPAPTNPNAAAASKTSGLSTQTTLQNVEIFALGERVESEVSAGVTGVTAKTGGGSQPLALLVDHQDAIIIKYIKDSGGTIDLALRSADEDRIVRTDAVTVDSIAERFRFRVPQEVPAVNNRTTRLRVLVLRDPGFQMGDQDTGIGDLTTVLEAEQSFKVTESPAGYGEAARAVQRNEVDIVIIDEVAGDPAAVVEQLDSAAPDVPVVVLLPEDQSAVAQACILAGARAYLVRPIEASDLIEGVQRIYEKEDRRRRKSNPQLGAKAGRMISVHGPKGGVGTTTISVNLAVALAQQTGRRVALMDGSLLSGDVGVAMNIAHENSIADVVAHLRELDGDLLNDTLVKHSTGIWVLPSPSELERAEVIGGAETSAVMTALRQHFDIVVVDTASRPDEHLLAALDQSDMVLVVCTPEIASLKNAARFLALAHELGYGDEKLKLTINRLSSQGSIPLKDIEANLRHRMAFGLPSDGIPVLEALNAGEPVVIMRPQTRIARELRNVATDLIALLGLVDDVDKPAVAGRFSLLGKMKRSRAS